MDLQLEGKTALVTGASKGIGRGVAEALAREGCDLILVARSGPLLEEEGSKLEQRYGRKVRHVAADLATPEALNALAALAPSLDILVNNAGAIPAGDIDAIDEARWREAWDLKVFGYINLTRLVHAAMKKAGRGVICNITGLAGDKPDAVYIAGSAGNASLNAFTRALGGSSLDAGVRVLAVSPGPVQTERLVGLLKTRAAAETGDEANWQSYMGGMPMGRAAHVEEVADLVTFLVSPRAAYISGTVVTIDGGHGSRGGSFSR